ncbi:hypothetical protein BU17DRAFT_96212 [Hysterangium stoloniferum]|nr:hypothetical protein BU17DRAFT_96212 [Hysterangium stoloniferum]
MSPRSGDFLRPLVISGPSGTGKITLISRFMSEHPDKLWAPPVASNLLHPFVIVNIAALISKIFVGAMRGELTKCGIGTKDTVEWQWYMEHGLLGMDSQIVVPVPRTSMGLMKTTTFDFEFCEPTFAK